MKSLSNEAYGNWVMLSPQGEIMCRCDEKRARWYLKRNIAIKVAENPPTIQLTFQPAGRGNAGDEFYTSERFNQCVVCGTEQELTKHHIVPSMYRVHLPQEFKSWSSHDVVTICIEDHKSYETEAWKLKMLIAEETGIPIDNGVLKVDRSKWRIRSLSSAIIKNEACIPAERMAEITSRLTQMLGKEPTREELLTLSKIDPNFDKLDCHGKLVIDGVKATGTTHEFIKRWRWHFLDVAQPKFMPRGWSLDKGPRS